MNRALPIVAICLSLLALAMSLVPRGDVAPPPVAVTAAADNDEDVEFLRRRIDLLEDDNRALWDRVTQLERRPMTSSDGGQVPASFAADLEKLRSEVHSLMAGDIANSEAGRAALKEQQRDRFAATEERRQLQAAQQAARWKDFSSGARLSYAADQKLNERLAYEESERAKKMEQLRTGEVTWQEVSSSLRTQRKETDDAVTSLLDDSQRQQYQQIRRGDNTGMRDMGGARQGGMNNPNGFQRGGGNRGKTGN
jgi:hypothetical protein